MLNSIILGLSALSSITGFSSGTNFEVTYEDYTIIAETINSQMVFGEDIDISNVIKYDDIHSIYGENRYLEVEIDGIGYLIYDKQENIVVEFNPNCLTPYKDYGDDVLKVYHYEENPYYIVYDDSDFILLNNDQKLNFSDFDYLTYNSKGTAGQYLTNVVPASDAVFIDHAYYFENLYDYHGLNDSGICVIISTQIALGYYDLFITITWLMKYMMLLQKSIRIQKLQSNFTNLLELVRNIQINALEII